MRAQVEEQAAVAEGVGLTLQLPCFIIGIRPIDHYEARIKLLLNLGETTNTVVRHGEVMSNLVIVRLRPLNALKKITQVVLHGNEMLERFQLK